MIVLGTRRFDGANPYAPVSVIRAELDLRRIAPRLAPGFERVVVDGLADAMPGLRSAADAHQEGGASPEVTAARLAGRVAIELQNLAGAAVAFHDAVPRSAKGLAGVVFEYRHRDVGLAALDAALAAVDASLPADRPTSADAERASFDCDAAIEALTDLIGARAIGRHMRAVVTAASARGISWSMPFDTGAFIQFGEGRAQRRTYWTATDGTGHVGASISGSKLLTCAMLRRQGLPVPRQQAVGSCDDAIAAARRIGFPVVVKPDNRRAGTAVSVGIASEDELLPAYERAQAASPTVIVESVLPGADHRLLVLDGELVAAAQRMPAHVVGDGVRTIRALIAEVNRDPRRLARGVGLLVPIVPDEESDRLLRRRGLTLASVPPRGDVVQLRSAANRSQGGMVEDVTDRIHPDNRWAAIRAARVVGLDVAGVDFLSPDIGRSYKEVGGGICEVNRQPGLLVHLAAPGVRSLRIGEALLDHVLPAGDNGRIPIVIVTGDGALEATAERVAALLRRRGRAVGLLTPAGVVSNGFELLRGDRANPEGVRMILRDPMIDAAVLALPPGVIAERGLGHRRCDVAAVVGSGRALSPGAQVGVAVAVANAGIAAVVDARSSSALDLAARVAAGRVVVVSPTGAGHDEIAAAVAEALSIGPAVAAGEP